ncbi:MAG TPA: tripartite tricarboxylate transporter substrate binding protein [Burkholderiales bacterium]|jgi:tripartite-type tricarboxylate transporter receptor subunit TctC
MTMAFACLLSRALPVLLLAAGAHAQSPARQITLVVPYTVASDADLAARNLAEHAPRYLGGQKIVVLNQPGASGAIATQAVRAAAPDGNTLLLARTASFVILPATDRKTPYQWGDFTLLSMMEINPIVCAVRADSPYFMMQGLLDDIRKRPGKLNFATVGEGTIQNFGPQYLFTLVGLPKEAAAGIPYKGPGELIAALLAGDVQFACSNLGTLLGPIRAGRLRPLMTTTREPLDELPGVPTAGSLGWREMESLVGWSALAGPRELPREVIDRWASAMKQLAHDPDWIAGNRKLGGVPAVRSPAETQAFVRAQFALYFKLAQRIGMRE